MATSHCRSSRSFALARSVHAIRNNFAHNQLLHHGLRSILVLITVNANSDYGIYYTRVTDPLVASFPHLGHPPPAPSNLRSLYARVSYPTGLKIGVGESMAWRVRAGHPSDNASQACSSTWRLSDLCGRDFEITCLQSLEPTHGLL